MINKDIDLITQLIKIYGIEKVKEMLETNKEILTYIYNTRFKDKENEEQSSFLYTESNNQQIFTNEKTSIFFLNNKVINLSLLSQSKELDLSKTLLVNPSEIQKFFDKSKKLFGNTSSPTTMITNNTFIFQNNKHSDIESININEYKLLNLLLKNPIVFTSSKNPVIYVESENGYAYVLGKRDGRQLKF